MTVSEISEQLRRVLASEKIEYEEAAIYLIARAAEGSMRDALSILDQVISFSGLKVSAQSVRDSIGLIGTELVMTLLRHVLERNAKAALVTVAGGFQSRRRLENAFKVFDRDDPRLNSHASGGSKNPRATLTKMNWPLFFS